MTRAYQAQRDSYYQPVGTERFYDGQGDFRLKGKFGLGDWGYFEAHYEAAFAGGDTVRKNNELARLNPALFGGYLRQGPISDDRRLMDLSRTISSDNSYYLAHRLDRLLFAWQPSWGTVRLGRQALTWGSGMLFNPMDLFNPFAPTDFIRDYKIGDDMAVLQAPLGNLGNLQVLAVPRRDPASGDVEADQSSAAAKLHLISGMTEFDLMAARHYGDNVAGLGATGYAGQTAWRADVTWTFLQDGGGYLSLVANMDYSWVLGGKNWYGWIEFYFNGLGRDDPGQALGDPLVAERAARGELFALGRAYVDAEVKVELHPLFNAFCTLILNLHDTSGIVQPRGVWDVTQNSQLTLGMNLNFGAPGSEYGGFRIPGLPWQSASPDSAYLLYTWYF
ncbi:MAG: hypothetical protein ABIK12_10875 [Pseudomonadota bacterium]